MRTELRGARCIAWGAGMHSSSCDRYSRLPWLNCRRSGTCSFRAPRSRPETRTWLVRNMSRLRCGCGKRAFVGHPVGGRRSHHRTVNRAALKRSEGVVQGVAEARLGDVLHVLLHRLGRPPRCRRGVERSAPPRLRPRRSTADLRPAAESPAIDSTWSWSLSARLWTASATSFQSSVRGFIRASLRRRCCHVLGAKVFAPRSGYDYHWTGRVVDALRTHGAQEQTLESAPAARTDDQ